MTTTNTTKMANVHVYYFPDNEKRKAKEAAEKQEAELRAAQPDLTPLHPYAAYKLGLGPATYGLREIGPGAAGVPLGLVEMLQKQERAVFVPFGQGR